MSDPTWICTNNPWHDFAGGLACRWCDATRTPGEAIVSGLANRRGGRKDAAKALLDAHRAEVLREAMRLIDAHPHPGDNPVSFYCGLLESLLPDAEEKATAEAATATPAEAAE